MRSTTLLWLALATFATACGDDDGGNPTDAGPDGGGGRGGTGGGEGGPTSGTGGNGGTSGGGSGGTVAPLMCGSQACEIPAGGAMMGIMPCCIDGSECGLETLLAPGECLPQGAPGGIDTSCPIFDVMSVLTWYGCCTPEGQCGALDSSGTLGCIPNASLMAAEQSCTYDPNNTCERLVEVTCDGAEDCGSEEKCCGEYEGGYRRTLCAADCAAQEMTEGGIWSELCHPGETCVTPEGAAAEYQCLQNTELLPDYLFRCRDTGETPAQTGSTAAGEINCGEDVCGSGEKCCISVPGLPVCIDADATCGCTPEGDADAGTEDAGS